MTTKGEYRFCDYCKKELEKGYQRWVIVPHTISSERPDKGEEKDMCTECYNQSIRNLKNN